MLTQHTNIDALYGRLKFGKRNIFVGEINGDEFCLNLVLGA